MAKRKKTPRKRPKKKHVSKKRTSEPQWKTVEKVVALLEKSLAPEARVRHNVKLPCLTTGHEEQCDVVIEVGKEPRVTRTIVEVQNRNERVKANDFRGWCQKMRDVGANCLICVSAQPFPQSIKEKVVKEFGPRVLLVRLEALRAEHWPFEIVNKAMKVYKPTVQLDPTVKPNPLLVFHPDNNPFQEHIGKLFNAASLPNVIQREGHAELLPLMDLVNEGVRLMNDRPDLTRLPDGVHRVPMHWRPKGVSFCFNGQTAPILEVRANYTIENQSFRFPFEISSYTHEGHDTSAWVARATGQVDGEDAEIRFTFMPTAEGGFTMTRPRLYGINEEVYFYWGCSNKQT